MDSKLRFDGKVALVTGAGSGIGRATALAFAREGAKVVVSDRDEMHGIAVSREIAAAGGDARFVRCDVSSGRDVAAMVETAVDSFGKIDCAFNNAGVGGAQGPLADCTDDNWAQVIGVNLSGVFQCMKYELRQMIAAGRGGAIVNNASILGTVGFAGAGPYVATKHAVLGLTKTAAMEYAHANIRVNAVCPAFIETPMLAQAGITTDPKLREAVANMHPMKRMGRAEEVAAAVLWLCDDASSFVTGHPLLVDGGYVAQ